MKTKPRTRNVKTAPPTQMRAAVPINLKAASDKDRLHALLFEALETEQNGVLVYETALKCTINGDLQEEWEKYLAQTRNHVTILTTVIKKLGMNPDQDTPGRNVVRHSGIGLVRTIEIAMTAGKPEAAQIVAAECIVLAETKDHLNWELIGAISDSLTGTEQQLLRTAYEQVEDEEDEHLYQTTGWARELHFQALGLPAQLPPVEEERDVKTEMEAAEARNERKAALAGIKKGGRNEEASGGKGPGIRRTGTDRSKRQNRRSAA